MTAAGRALIVFGGVLACTCPTVELLGSQEPAPTFRGGADLVTIDVQIVPARPTALPVLTADRFDVRISGQKRTVVSAVFVHYDEGAIVARPSAQSMDPAPLAACAFRYLRTSDAVHAHYRLAIETRDDDRKKVSKVRIKVSDKTISLRGWIWRSSTGK